jgi:adenylate kinase family enzyme
VVLGMVREALEQAKDRGYVIDGIPRTMDQARALYEMAVELDMTADVALHLQVEDAELMRRCWPAPPSRAARTTPRTSSGGGWSSTTR